MGNRCRLRTAICHGNSRRYGYPGLHAHNPPTFPITERSRRTYNYGVKQPPHCQMTTHKQDRKTQGQSNTDEFVNGYQKSAYVIKSVLCRRDLMHVCYHPRSPTDIQREQVVGALSSLKRFGQGPSWSPVVTVIQSASFKNAQLKDYIDECASGPCINGGTCNDHVNYFTCDCTNRYNGTVCEKDCRPGPVDLLFVLDTSSSSQDDCYRMKGYMSTIVNQLAVGPDDFQIGAVTYSFSPTLEWSFTQYSDNETVIQAIDSINCTGGATYTGKALEYAIEVFSDPINGGRQNSAFKQIVLITDGLSTDRSNTIQQSWNVMSNSIKLYVVGLGHYVDHRELNAMVHDSRYVFSTKDNELLLTILRETAHPDCNDCLEDSSTDIVLLLDSSSNERIKYSTKAAIELVEYLDVDNTEIQMGIMSYSEATQVILPIEKHTQNDLSSSVTKVRLSSAQETNISDAIESGKTELNNFGRTYSKKVLVLFTDGKGNRTMESRSFIQDTVDEGINVFIFGIGEDVGYETIRNAVTDSFYGLLSADTNDHTPLQTVKSESWHTTCNENIFKIRV
ncbi:hypothetical protein FSP39_011641 [Pinctada imbricata]|uniref:Uncharacterized protein n=1 Tax=Pinctada imbricata TaxID=66713 RepID=A0AA88XN98_PINIB|nr:hypothetical protein FSP39_011641 [Pinctada imbricata]